MNSSVYITKMVVAQLRYWLLVNLIMLIGGLSAQGQCPTGDVSLTSQAQVDAFPAGCSTITGRLNITGADITSLTALSSLTRVTQDVTIDNNPQLTSLNGLGQLRSIGGRLSILENATLPSLDGLSSLTTVGSVYIQLNPQLTSLSGLGQLRSVGGLNIIENATLPSLDGLSSLTTVGSVYIQLNPQLTSLSGLGQLRSVGGTLYISGNATLPSLDGLSSLTTVALGVTIQSNPQLTNLSGLGQLSNLGGSLGIRLNATLSSLDGLSSLTTAPSSIIIEDNPQLTSLSGLSQLRSGFGLFISGNDILPNLAGLSSLTTLGGLLAIDNNPQLTSLNGLGQLRSVGGLNIIGNATLPSLAGLTSLSAVNGSINIEVNPELTSLNGLGQLRSIGGRLSILENATLPSLAGLTSLTTVGSVYIQLNPQLNTCATESICRLLATSVSRTIDNNAPGCNSSAEILAICAKPTITSFTFAPNPVCVGNPVTFTATLGNVAGAYSYTLSNGSTTLTGTASTNAFSRSLTASGSGSQSFTLLVRNGGQSATATANVLVNSLPVANIHTPASTTLTCGSPTLSLTATGGGTYRWDDNSINAVRPVSSSGTYSVTVTSASGCTATASTMISQDNIVPTVSINPSSATLSCTTSSVSLSAVGSGTYRWNTGATTASISATSATTYSVTLTGANGCTATASAQIFQDTSAPSVSITPSSATLTCTNPSATLTASGNGTYRWSTGATSQTISVGTANTYSVTLTAGNGCTATTSAQVGQDINLPTVSISPTSATLTCATPSVSLSAVGSGTYLWNTGATTASISVTAAGTYSVTLTGGNGCSATALAQVAQDNAMPTVNITANPSLTIGSGQSATLTAGGATTYGWSNGATTSVIVVNAAGTYSVTGTTSNGCSATASVVVSQTAPFAIASVTANTCQQIASNRYVISFTPVYTGTNGQPISFSVVNEVFPTTAPGPYTLQLYTDNPTITLKAQQGGTPGEVTYVYNWLAACTAPMPNTPPRVNQPLTDQIARVGEGFGYTLPQVTFTDNESPQSLVVTVSGLPTGLSFSPPTQIGGVPSVTGVSTVTVTATDPQGLSVSTSFVLTVVEPNATNTPPTLVNPIPAQVGIQGQPFSLNVATTFTDAQTPNGLVLSASGLPAGLNLVGTTISGTPSVSGTSTVSLTAVDPGGLSATTSFGLTIQPASVTASGPFAITGVSPLTCTQVANNRFEISFTPRYSGVNGQAINFWVENELVPTTAPGPYSLQLYNDNPTIVLKAKQDGSAGETTFSYNWLAGCGTPPQPNTPPRVNIPLTNQVAKVGEGFGYTIPQITFTDNETPQSLVLTVSGLPAGMNFSPPTQIGGVPSVSGVSSVTVTATDPGGLSVFATFSLTVLPANAPSGFAITGVQTLSCVSAGANRRTITFTPQYSGLDGSPVSFSVVNELLPTTASGPYTLTLYTDNATLQLRAQQGGATASYAYNWLAVCNAPTRQGVGEAGSGLQVKVLGNPIQTQTLELEINGAEGQSVVLSVVNLQGYRLDEQRIDSSSARQRVRLSVESGPGVLLLQVRTASESQTVRVVKAN